MQFYDVVGLKLYRLSAGWAYLISFSEKAGEGHSINKIELSQQV